MRVLLDESLPRPLAALLSGPEIRIVAALGWSGIENGELPRLAAERFETSEFSGERSESAATTG